MCIRLLRRRVFLFFVLLLGRLRCNEFGLFAAQHLTLIGIVDAVGHDVVRLEVLMGIAENLYVLVVRDHHSALFELILLPKALDTSLTEAYKAMAQFSASLEQRTHRAAHDDLDLHWCFRLLLPDSHRR